MRRRFAALASGIAIVLLGLSALPAVAHPTHLQPDQLRWRQLELSASKLFVTAHTRVELRPATASEVRSELSAAAFATGIEPRDTTFAAEVDVQIAGRRTEDLLLFRAQDAAALLRRKRALDKSPYDKLYRHGPSGVALRRRAPADKSESRLAAERWSQIERFDYPYAKGASRSCPVVSEPSALLWVIAVHSLTQGETIELCVFTNSRIHRVAIEAGGLESVSGRYLEVGADGRQTERTGPFQARRLIVRPRSLEAGGNADEFELLGLAGDIELLVERDSRVPLVISGRLPHLGAVEVKLDRVTLR